MKKLSVSIYSTISASIIKARLEESAYQVNTVFFDNDKIAQLQFFSDITSDFKILINHEDIRKKLSQNELVIYLPEFIEKVDSTVTYLFLDSRLNQLHTNNITLISSIKKAYQRYFMYFDATSYAILSNLIENWLKCRTGQSIKLIACDLDNTLWMGAATEEVSQEQSEDNPYYHVREYLKILNQNYGILLAIASKNDSRNLKTYIGKYAFPLDYSQFIAVEADQSRRKNLMLENICRDTNIKPKHIVFYEDDGVERELCRHLLNSDNLIDSNNPIKGLSVLKMLCLEAKSNDENEAKREASIKNNIDLRKIDADNSAIQAYLKRVGARLQCKEITNTNASDLQKICSFVNRTNQYNINGKRIIPSELEAYITSDKITVLRYNYFENKLDYGLVALVISDKSTLLSFVFSCRASGRQLEETIFAHFLDSIKVDSISVNFRATTDNLPIKRLLEKWESYSTDAWTLKRDKISTKDCFRIE